MIMDVEAAGSSRQRPNCVRLRTLLTRVNGIDADIDLVQATIDEKKGPISRIR